MSETKDAATPASRTDRYELKRKKRIQNVKTGGDMMMYIGSAGLIIPMIRKAKESQNSIMGTCAMGAGAVLAIGLGNVASKILNKTIDKAADFWEDVKPSGPARKTEKKTEDEGNG